MIGWVWTLAALAQGPEGGPEPDPSPSIVAPMGLEDVLAAQSPEAVLTEAILRREQGDLDGADARLRHLEARAPGAAVAFQQGLVAELREEYEKALAYYDIAMRDGAGGPDAVQAAYRRVVVHNDLGQPELALEGLDALGGGWHGEDGATLEIERGIAEIALGRGRRGVARIEEALEGVEGTDRIRWQRSRARAALLDVLVDASDAIALDRPRRADRDVAERRRLITEADAQRAAIVELGEPEYALVALERIGDGALALHADVRAAPPPRKVAKDAERMAIYQAEVVRQAERFRSVAFQYYDAGAELAVRVNWPGTISGRLREKRDRLREEMGES